MDLAKTIGKHPGALALGWSGVCLMAPEPYQLSLVALGFAIAGVAALHTKGIWKRFVIAWLLRLGRLARHSERTFRTSVPAETLWLVAAAAFVTSLGTATWFPQFAELAAFLGIYAAAMGGAIYAGCVGLRLGKLAWVRATGKITIGVLAAVFVCISRAAASELVAGITHTDPKSFPVFLDFITALLTPCLGVGVVAAFAVTLATLAIGVALLRLLVRQTYPGQWLLAAIAKMPGLRSRRRRAFTILPMPLVVCMMSAIVGAGFIVAGPMGVVRDNREFLASLATNVLVYADFHANVACDGVSAGDRVASIGQGKIVVARPAAGERWSFGEQACRVGEGAAAEVKLTSAMVPNL